MKVCLNCKYWIKNTHDKTYGNCHRYPPVVILDSEDNKQELLPFVNEQDWCGEHVGDNNSGY